MLEPGDESEHVGVALDAALLAHADPLVADAVARRPKAALEALELALIDAQERLLEAHPARDRMALRPQAHPRLHGLPYSLDPAPHALNPTIGRIGSAHIGRLVTVRGTVVKAGPVKMFEHQRLMRCGRCGHRFYAKADPDDLSRPLALPDACPSRPGPRGPCPGANFVSVDAAEAAGGGAGGAGGPGAGGFTNAQEVRVQERLQCLDAGSVPSAISVLLLDEMADSCQAGGESKAGEGLCVTSRLALGGGKRERGGRGEGNKRIIHPSHLPLRRLLFSPLCTTASPSLQTTSRSPASSSRAGGRSTPAGAATPSCSCAPRRCASRSASSAAPRRRCLAASSTRSSRERAIFLGGMLLTD